MVRRAKIINVIVAAGGLMLVRTSVAPPIKWINRWPAVMLAVKRTARAIGWMNRLIVSMIISIGIREMGVPWGKKWASEDFSLWRKPRITAPAHNGIAIPKFIDNCVVGVNVCGKRPRRLVEPMNIIKDASISDHVRPLGEWINIICLVISLISHNWNEWKRFGISRLEEVKSAEGSIMIRTTIGRPIIVGVMKEENRFSFILILRGYLFLYVLLI